MVEFYPRENAKEHHTDMFELVSDSPGSTPVLRRGQNFFFAIRFDRAFEQARDFVRVNFVFGPKPSVTKGTRVILPLSHRDGTSYIGMDTDRMRDRIQMDDKGMPIDRMDRMDRSMRSPMDSSRYPHQHGWNIQIHRQDGNTLSLQVFIPPHAQVGIWRCSIQTNFQGQRVSHSRDYKVSKFVIFH